MQLLLATRNRNKGTEIASLLQGVDGISIITLSDLPEIPPEPVEDGATLEENAYIKARLIHLATGIPTIADDTGLEVDALGGRPGVHSARYAGENATYADNCRKLLDELSTVDHENRSARFRTVICYCDEKRVFMVEGTVAGNIVEAERGMEGFGYDPVFVPQGCESTFSEMTPSEKNSISHRGRALRTFVREFKLLNEAGMETRA